MWSRRSQVVFYGGAALAIAAVALAFSPGSRPAGSTPSSSSSPSPPGLRHVAVVARRAHLRLLLPAPAPRPPCRADGGCRVVERARRGELAGEGIAGLELGGLLVAVEADRVREVVVVRPRSRSPPARPRSPAGRSGSSGELDPGRRDRVRWRGGCSRRSPPPGRRARRGARGAGARSRALGLERARVSAPRRGPPRPRRRGRTPAGRAPR